MSNRYGYRKREDQSTSLIPAGSPEPRIGAPTSGEARKTQALPGSGHITDASAGTLRSEDDLFLIDLDLGVISIRDETGQERVLAGVLPTDPETYGIEVRGPDGEIVLGATGLGVDVVGSAQLADGAVGDLALGEDAVREVHIQDGAVTTTKVDEDAITVTQLAPNSVTHTQIEEGAVTEFALQPGAVTETRIREGAVTNTRIAQNTIVAGNIFAGTITAAEIAAGTITANEILAGTITANEMEATNVSALFADLGEITAGMMRDADNLFIVDLDNSLIWVQDEQASSVTRVRLGRLGAAPDEYGLEVRDEEGNLIIDASGLGLGVVGGTQIIDGAITTDKIAANQITANEIASGTITANEILAGTITANEMEADELSALFANVGVLTAGILQSEDERFRINLDQATLEVTDENQTLRLRVGRLGSGSTAYGISVLDDSANVILSADGLGIDVVGNAQLSDSSVGTANIQNGAVESLQVGTGAITTAKIGDAQITTAKIGNAQVTNAKIEFIDAAKITTGFLDADRIQSDSIHGEKIQAGTINAEQLDSIEISVGKHIESDNFVSGTGGAGWRLSATTAEFNDVIIRGTLQGVEGTFSGVVEAESFTSNATWQGDLSVTILGPSISGEGERPTTLRWGELEFGNISGVGGSTSIQNNVTTGRLSVSAPGDVEVDSDLEVTGDVVAFSTSDERLKFGIEPLTWTPLDDLLKIRGVGFRWSDDAPGWTKKINGRDVGVLAQDVQKVIPEAVREGLRGRLSVSYDRIVPLMIEAIRELEGRVYELERVSAGGDS